MLPFQPVTRNSQLETPHFPPTVSHRPIKRTIHLVCARKWAVFGHFAVVILHCLNTPHLEMSKSLF